MDYLTNHGKLKVILLKFSIWSSNFFYTIELKFASNCIYFFFWETWIEKKKTEVKKLGNIGGDFEIFLKISF